MVDRSHPRLSVGEQCRLLSLPRSTFYYTPQGETPLNLTLMRRIDEQFLETPFYGVRQMTWHLRAEGTPVNEKRIRRLMRLMGLMPIYQRPKTSIRAKEHRIWPYLLRSLRINRANHVWCADVTYIPMQRGFLYLTVIMDWATRKVLAWRLSNTLDAEPCVDALTEAIARHGAPECKCWIKIPQKCWRKIPHFSVSGISRACDWRLRSWVDGRAFSGAAVV